MTSGLFTLCSATVFNAMPGEVTPEIRAHLDAADPHPAVWEISPPESRAIRSPCSAQCEPEAVFSVTDRYIPGPTADLHIRIFRPSADQSIGCHVYYHGGGWVLQNIDYYTATLHQLANSSGCAVIAVNYQKAPEHPYPQGFDDCYATLLWVAANASALGVDSTKISVGGDSAGGNLASAVALKARDTGSVQLCCQLLVYPANDRDFSTSSYTEFGAGFGLSRQSMEWFWSQYLGAGMPLN